MATVRATSLAARGRVFDITASSMERMTGGKRTREGETDVSIGVVRCPDEKDAAKR
jgi:hypothetical protein